MMIRKALLNDLPYIEWLRRHNSEAVGFIPIQRYEMEINGERNGDILVCSENNDLVGFIYTTHGLDHTHIQQIVIQEDARLMERGRALVNTIIRPQDWLISCRCADDLQASKFWEQLGFERVANVLPKSVYGRGKDKLTLPTRRKRSISRWEKTIGGLFLPIEVE